MKISLMLAAGLSCCAAFAWARPVLNDSQQTYFSACIADDSPAKEQVSVCQAALSEQGLSTRQRQDVEVELADALYDLDRYQDAESLYEAVLANDAGNLQAVNGLAWVYWSRDEYMRAITAFETSVNLGPTSTALAGLASSGRHAETISQDRFVELLNAALALNPDYTWAQRELGWGLVDFGDYEGAEAAFRKAVDMAPRNQWSLYALGYILNKQDRYEEALEALVQVNTNKDTPTGYYSQLSLARYHMNDFKAALKNAELTIEGWPDSGTGYVRKARALAALGRGPEAISLLQARQDKAFSGFVAYWLADLLFEDGQVKAAMDVMNMTVQKGVADVYDHEMRAFLALELEDFEAAWASVDAALIEDPAADYALYYKALLQVEAEDFDTAETTMEQALGNGLSKSRIKGFLSAVMAKGQYVRAIQWRVAMREKEE